MKADCSTFSSSNTYAVGALMWLTDGDEKCVLKLCVYKTPFDKSGHIFALIIHKQIDT